jgi:hypothetical protein
MKRYFRSLGPAGGVALVLLFLGSATRAAGQEQAYRLVGDRVGIWNLAGVVGVQGGGGSDVVVEVRRGGSDASRLEVATGTIEIDHREVRSVESLRVIYPGDEVAYSGGEGRTELRVKDDGTFWADDDERGRKVRVSDSGGGLEAHADLEITVPPGKTVLVFLAVGQVTIGNVSGDLTVDVGSASIRSSGTQGRLVLDTGSGNVWLSETSGDVTVDTGSGNVEVNGVGGSSLNIDTGSGNVSGSGIEVASLIADTGSGNVELARVSASEIAVDTGSGGVALDLLTDVRAMTIDTGSGDVEVTVPGDFGATVELDTGSGSISTDVPIQMTEMDDDYIRGVIGDGNGEVQIDTGSGSVNIRNR